MSRLMSNVIAFFDESTCISLRSEDSYLVSLSRGSLPQNRLSFLFVLAGFTSKTSDNRSFGKKLALNLSLSRNLKDFVIRGLGLISQPIRHA